MTTQIFEPRTTKSDYGKNIDSLTPTRKLLQNVEIYILILPFIALVILFILAPLGWIIINAFYNDLGELTLGNIKDIFSSKFYLQAIGLSLKISLYSSVISLLIGFQGAYSLEVIKDSTLGRILIAINTVLSNFSGVPLAFAMIIVFGSSGVMTLVLAKLGLTNIIDIYSFNGILLSYIYFQIPLATLLLFPAISGLQKHWQENAYLLGASAFQYFFKVGLPVLSPAILGTFIILFANALGAYATAYALTSGSFNILPIRIAALIAGNLTLQPNMAAALAFILVSLMFIVTIVHQYLLGRYHT